MIFYVTCNFFKKTYNVIALFTNNTIMKALHMVTFLVLIVGWVNWWLVGFLNFDLVAYLFGEMSTISKIVYSLVWLSALYELFTHKSNCKMCSSNNSRM